MLWQTIAYVLYAAGALLAAAAQLATRRQLDGPDVLMIILWPITGVVLFFDQLAKSR